jgi:hypothetical protein
VEEMREKGVPTDARLYLPGRKWHSQRTLSRVVHVWPTPTSSDGHGSTKPESAKDWEYRGTNLPEAVQKASVGLWPTPVSSDATGGRTSKGKDRPDEGGLAQAVKLWPTPKSSPSGPDYARADRPESGGDDLATSVARETFPTPRASMHDAWTMESERLSGQKKAEMRDEGHPFQTEIGGQLNPMWVEWLMGFPEGWTDLEDSETP